MDLRWIQNPKVKGKQTMNKLIRSAMMMASVGAMLCIVGCGDKREKTPEYIEYKKMMDKVPMGYGLSWQEQKDKLEKFKTLSSEDQKKAKLELSELLKSLQKQGLITE